MSLSVLGNLTCGFAGGYLVASLIESAMHQHVSDAPKKTVKRWERFPRLFRYLIRTRYSHHIVHHRRTFKQDHITQFRSMSEQEALDQELADRGRHGRIIQRSSYAVRLHGSGALVFVAPLLPAVPLTAFTLGVWGTLGCCAALALPPLFSHFIHPFLHMPHSKAMREAPRLTAWLLRRWYFRSMARNHYMHHRYLASNFNLVLGGDVLRRRYRSPTESDLGEMQRLGLRID
ncbi:hypothetical protein ABID97_005586 [Variovorax sp. OAS795]|uniref:hypothetical protein n=1 Tax=Variovorax sp. OAS795 TaxID=3034231 RepID=UPI0033935185